MEILEVEEIRRRLAPTLDELKVVKAILFGSLSRRTGTRKSDIDLLVVVDTSERFFGRFYDLLKGRSVDLLIYTPSELERISHRPFVRRILSEGRKIYGH